MCMSRHSGVCQYIMSRHFQKVIVSSAHTHTHTHTYARTHQHTPYSSRKVCYFIGLYDQLSEIPEVADIRDE